MHKTIFYNVTSVGKLNCTLWGVFAYIGLLVQTHWKLVFISYMDKFSRVSTDERQQAGTMEKIYCHTRGQCRLIDCSWTWRL